MTTNDQNGHLPATPIDVEPTDRQRAAHELAAAFGAAGEIDWAQAEANFRALAEAAGYESPVIEMGRKAAVRINEALLAGQEPLQADLDAVRYALDQVRRAEPLTLVDGIPAYYWQGWLIENWLPRNCVAMLTGDGGVGKSRLALQLAWSLSGDGQWLGEAGQMPSPGADYGMGFEPLGPGAILYATWEDSPEQIRGRLFWLEQVRQGRQRQQLQDCGYARQWTPVGPDRPQSCSRTHAGRRGVAPRGRAARCQVAGCGHAWRRQRSERDRPRSGWSVLRGLGRLGRRARLRRAAYRTSAKDRGRVTYSGSTGILGGVRAMWTIESVRRECRGNCSSPRNCTCEPAYAYRLVNAKQNYSEKTGSVWLTNQRGVWMESQGRAPDYDGKVQQPAESDEDAREMFQGAV